MTTQFLSFCAAVLFSVAAWMPAAAQQIPPADTRPWIPLDSLSRTVPRPDSLLRPDVTIRASVRAREIRFETEPHANVRAWACPGLETVRVKRENLPELVEPGVMYRNAYASIEIHATLAADTALQRMLGMAPADSSVANGCAPAQPLRDVADRQREERGN